MTRANSGARSKASTARTLGRTAATLVTVGMIIGTGIFGALSATAEYAGSALLLAMIPGGLVCWATGISGAQLRVNFPKHGGAFLWARAFCTFRNFFRALLPVPRSIEYE